MDYDFFFNATFITMFSKVIRKKGKKNRWMHTFHLKPNKPQMDEQFNKGTKDMGNFLN